MPELDALRAELAEIDKKIMALVGRRNEIAKVIGEEKAKTGAAVVVPPVERIVEQRYIDAGAKQHRILKRIRYHPSSPA